jgi:hypothetical protein
MPQTIFFSWQSDTPDRNFIRGALEDACRALGRDTTTDEAPRDLNVDSDTQDVPGQPPIVETIFRKIDAAAMFVADMTFVATRDGSGRSPNPNVLIEYGWALKSLTHERVISVMNTAYGEPSGETLPFDLRHARWPIRYNLPAHAPPDEKSAKKKRLAKDLERAICACLLVAPQAPASPRRIPLTELRALAAAAGWSVDVQASTLGDNDWWNFAKKLRQAAVDGTIPFFGRQYLFDQEEDTDPTPLSPIPPTHFVEFGFDVIQLATAKNYDIFTAKPGDPTRAWRGNVFRDLHVGETEARRWLETEGEPPAPADMEVRVIKGGTTIPAFDPACSLVVRNIGHADLEHCLVEIIDLAELWPDGMVTPFPLRTTDQIRDKGRGRFLLSPGQEASIPILFHRHQSLLPQRSRRPSKNDPEWFFADEGGERYVLPAAHTKLIVRIYGGPNPSNARVSIDTDTGGNALPSVRIIKSSAALSTAPSGN